VVGRGSQDVEDLLNRGFLEPGKLGVRKCNLLIINEYPDAMSGNIGDLNPPEWLLQASVISFVRDLMRRAASFIFDELSPILRASSMIGSSLKFASPFGWLTWMCSRLSSRGKKKNRNSPSRMTVGDQQAPPHASQHGLASPSEAGKSSRSTAHTFSSCAMRIRLSASFQEHICGSAKDPRPSPPVRRSRQPSGDEGPVIISMADIFL